jgi:hypothetical protein
VAVSKAVSKTLISLTIKKHFGGKAFCLFPSCNIIHIFSVSLDFLNK